MWENCATVHLLWPIITHRERKDKCTRTHAKCTINFREIFTYLIFYMKRKKNEEATQHIFFSYFEQ